jgi:hypothetical protein
MEQVTLIMGKIVFLFFATPFLYFYHRTRYMAILAIVQYVLNAVFMYSLLLYPYDMEKGLAILKTMFHLCLGVSSVLVLIVTFRAFVECIQGIFGK